MHTHTHSHSQRTHRLVQLPHFPYLIEPEQLVKGLCEGVKLDVFFPGFPSLKHIPHTGQLEKRGVRVFQSASRGENLCLTITPREIPKVSCEILLPTVKFKVWYCSGGAPLEGHY